MAQIRTFVCDWCDEEFALKPDEAPDRAVKPVWDTNTATPTLQGGHKGVDLCRSCADNIAEFWELGPRPPALDPNLYGPREISDVERNTALPPGWARAD